MRWNNLLLDESPRDPALTTPLFDQGAVVRRFDTPEFRGITFIGAEANCHPSRPAMPFSRTINPYGGCSHACRSGVRPSVVADEVRAKRTKSSALCQRRLTPIGGPGDCG